MFLLVATLPGVSAAADASTPEFFEKRIRPVLVAQCYACHSADAAKAKKLRGGLALDTRDALRAGGDTGDALAPGKPAMSLLVQSLKYAGDLKMPPTGKLPDAVVADFEAWVAAGAPDPRTEAAAAVKKQVGPSVAEGRNFWAYRPVPAHDPHASLDAIWLKGLAAKKLAPAAPAEPGVWLRRVTFDLSGLPPTVAELDAFAAAHGRDPEAAAAEVVDRLLASPAFGERWGRHWLDVARYADSVTLRGTVYPQAWRYRDYVIDGFNADRPFDRMVREQIAGDLLPGDAAEVARGRVATAFLALGNTNLEEQDKKQLRMDVVDEQLDVITKGFLAQTVTCARCHDHKFDPIPTKDYYALAGILRNVKALETANVSAWVEVPLPGSPADDARYAAATLRVAALTETLKVANAKKPAAQGVLAVKDVPGLVVDDAQAKRVGAWKESTSTGVYVGAGYLHDDNDQKGDKTLTFQPDAAPVGTFEVLLAYSHGTSRAAAVPVTVFSAGGDKTVRVDMRPPPAVEGRYASLGVHRFEKDGQCYATVSNEGTTGHVTADAVVFRTPGAADKSPKAEAAADGTKPLAAELKSLNELLAKRPKAMTVLEEAKIEDARVHVRGGVHTLGEIAPRGVLQVASTGPVAMPAGQSGRLQLADWIASPANPLTARVAANRAWHWLFGAGLVRTVDNFGLTGETPSHPELLDHLASQFVADGWSTKRLVRRIVLSRAYRQSSEVNAAAKALDPENRLFARSNRRRLEGEPIRDAMLAVSGKLDRTPGGPAFPPGLAADYGYAADSDRRTVYLPMFRNAMPELLATFDGADPSVVTGQRNAGTVAPQALYLMNHPFPAAQARHAAARHLAGHPAGDVTFAYRETLGRAPTTGEAAAVGRHLARHADALAGWAGVYHALFASADFRTLD